MSHNYGFDSNQEIYLSGLRGFRHIGDMEGKYIDAHYGSSPDYMGIEDFLGEPVYMPMVDLHLPKWSRKSGRYKKNDRHYLPKKSINEWLILIRYSEKDKLFRRRLKRDGLTPNNLPHHILSKKLTENEFVRWMEYPYRKRSPLIKTELWLNIVIYKSKANVLFAPQDGWKYDFDPLVGSVSDTDGDDDDDSRSEISASSPESDDQDYLDHKHNDDVDDKNDSEDEPHNRLIKDTELKNEVKDGGTIRECVQCRSTKNDGVNRCSRTTCKYAHSCWQHTKYRKGLYLAPSSLGDHAGTGLFANKDFEAGETITKYGGKLLDEKEYDQTESVYGIQVGNGKVRDASSTQSGLGRWVNDARDRDINNATLVKDEDDTTKIIVVAERNIEKGEEILADYGKQFWNKHKQ